MAFRVVLYLAFVLVAAPFEILLDLWAGVMRPDAQLRLRPIAEGLVYIYAFTLIIETWFRMQSKPEVLRRKAWLKWLQLVCILLILVFMLDYMGELRPRLMDGERVPEFHESATSCSYFCPRLLLSFILRVGNNYEEKSAAMITLALLAIAGLVLIAVATAEFDRSTALGTMLRAIAARQLRTLADLENIPELSVDELALIEKYVPNLRTVVILCHRVDEPNASLAKAVLDNFQQGAAYTFFVSPDESQDEDLARYQDWFRCIFGAAQGASPPTGENSVIRRRKFDDVFAIKRLPLDWQNVPYVFYSFGTEAGEVSTIAFKGTQPGVGISDEYIRVGATEARAIVDLCSAASAAFSPAFADKDVDLNDESMPDTKIDVKIIDFPVALGGRR